MKKGQSKDKVWNNAPAGHVIQRLARGARDPMPGTAARYAATAEVAVAVSANSIQYKPVY